VLHECFTYFCQSYIQNALSLLETVSFFLCTRPSTTEGRAETGAPAQLAEPAEASGNGAAPAEASGSQRSRSARMVAFFSD
jgi:hypothetical protein